MPQVASEAHAASHASARSGQRNRPANAPTDAPSTPFASLVDRAAGDGDIAPRVDQPADAVKQPETSRHTERNQHDRRDASRAADGSRSDKPVHRRNKSDKAENDTDPAEARDATKDAATDTAKDTTAAGDSDAAGCEDTVAGDDSKDSTEDSDADSALAEGIPAIASASQTDIAKPVEAVAAPVVTAQTPADGSEAVAQADIVIGGDKPATPALLATHLKVAAGEDDTKADGKTETVKPDADKTADAGETPDDATLRDALKAQHAGQARDGKPSDSANAKPADGDAKPAEQKTHHANAEQAADTPAPGGGSHTAQAQASQAQTQTPQVANAVQHGSQPANAAAAPQAPAVPVEGVAVQIATQAKAGKHSFDIRLDPPELGRIDVRLDVDRHGHVTSRLVVDRPETLDLLRRDAGGLERALQDAGLKTSDNGLQFSLRDQTMQQQAFQQSRDTAEVIVKDDTLPPVETMQRGYRTLAGTSGGVDIRV